jgi:hypothetical protein
MKSRILRTSPLLAAALLLFACRSGEALDPKIEKLGRATGPVAPSQRAAASPVAEDGPDSTEARPVHEGVVLERIHVPNYTYLRLGLADGREAWAAVPKTEIEVGVEARVVESLVMHEFRSPTLDRAFETIVFGVLEGGAGRPGDAGPTDDVGADDVRAVQEPPLQRGGTQLPPGHPPI